MSYVVLRNTSMIASDQVRLVNETHAIALVQAGTQANHFASGIDCAGRITNFIENCAGKSFFFSEDSKESCPFCICHKKSNIMN